MDNTNFIRKFRASFDKAQQRSDQRRNFKATLGHPDGRLATVRTNYFYARVQFPDGVATSEVLCVKLTPTYDAQVYVAYNLNDELEVQGFNSTALTYFGEFTPPSAGLHAWTHGLYPAPDTLISDGLQLNILRVTPTNTPSSSVYVTPYLYQDSDTSLALMPGGTVDLAPYIPTDLDQQTLMLVGFNVATGSVQALQGTTQYFSGYNRTQMPFALSDIASVTGTQDFVSAAAVRLMYGITEIQPYDILAHTHQWYDANVGGVTSIRRGGTGQQGDFQGYVFFNNGTSYPVRIIGQQSTPPTVNDDSGDGFIVGSEWYTSNGFWKNVDASVGASYWLRCGMRFSTANVSTPPTDAELDSAFGTPASVGPAFTALLDDNGAGVNVYWVASNGTSWYYNAMILAV